MIQKSYENKKSILYLVPTPIGNLQDITFRAVEVLKNVDVIFAEDTRVTQQLLNSLSIKNHILACHKFNESKMSKVALQYLENGKNIALVTDRGTPLISDPGSLVVSEVIKNNYNVVALPGASAFLPALNMSDISSERFLFYGFLNSKESQARKELEMLNDINFTIILYEAPHRLYKTLQNILKIMGNRKISISREITKKYEEVFRGCVQDAINIYKVIKGEIVIIIESSNKEKEINYDSLLGEVDNLISLGVKPTDAIKEVSKNNEVNKNVLYKLFQGRKK